MSVIQISQQTTLTGVPLQNAINAMIDQMRRMSPYNALNVERSWPSGSRMTLRAGTHMTGSVDLTFGSPSTVTSQINLLSSLAEGQRSRIEQDMIRLAGQHLPMPSGSRDQPTTLPPEAPTGQATQQQSASSSQGRPFNWMIFGDIMTGLFGGASQAVNAYNQAGQQVAQQAASEAVVVAEEEAASHGFQKPAPPSGLVIGNEKGQAQQPIPEEEAQASVQSSGFPTWAWWALGIGGAATIGLVIYFATRKDDEEDDRPKRNYGFRYYA